jgi:hypothetical protein
VILKNQQPVVIALTWGVFSNREIVQPAVNNSEVFLIWKEEAFNLRNELEYMKMMKRAQSQQNYSKQSFDYNR